MFFSTPLVSHIGNWIAQRDKNHSQRSAESVELSKPSSARVSGYKAPYMSAMFCTNLIMTNGGQREGGNKATEP